MSIFQAAILGIIQGLGEFLPISSTAHLILAPYFFGWPDPGLSFDVALHLGTLIAVLAYFWRDWLMIFKLTFVSGGQGDADGRVYNKNILWLLVIGTIPGAIIGYLFENDAETIFRSPLLIAFTLAIVGLILYLADRYAHHARDMKQINLKDSIVIGLSQAVAIIPGVSRSGATITAGLLCGLDRVSAARFSFLLSTPIIFGAAVLKVPHLLEEGVDLPIVVGILISAFSGFLAIKYLLKFVERASYAVFFWYRLVLAAIILLVFLIR